MSNAVDDHRYKAGKITYANPANMHHHLGILRSAGLLAIHDGGVRGWRYRIREESFRGIAASLDAYLRSEPE